MSGFEKQTYTQVPNSLFEVMSDMDECELKVVLYICRYTFGYHREEVKISTRKLAVAIDMSVASVDKGANAAVKRGLIERVTDGQNTTIWRALVSDSEIESPKSDTENRSRVLQNLKQFDSDNESQVGIKERKEIKSKEKELIINNITATLFTESFGKFHGQKEQERWQTLYDSIGPDRAESIISWAVKKEIHLTNRPGLLDSLETAAKNWKDKPANSAPKAQPGLSVADRWLMQKEGSNV